MLLENVNELNPSEILSEDFMIEISLIEDAFVKEQKLQQIRQKAKALGILTDFKNLYNAFQKEMRKELKTINNPSNMNVTQFEGQPPYKCGGWHADMDGVWRFTDKGRVIYACPHPIYINRIFVNSETGIHKVEICYKIRHKWKKIIVDRKTIANRSSIVQLADHGIQINSVNADELIQYLSDLEAYNQEEICEYTSTSRLGWGENHAFIPYDKDVVFDAEHSIVGLYNSIKQVGNSDEWYECVKDLRKTKRIEPLIAIAASLGSILVELIGGLPFIVAIWGKTGGGKTVTLMLATSIWADPGEGEYMVDAKSTPTAMEIHLNVLKNFPMIIDDLAQIQDQYDGDFSKLIYSWCSGKGKGRANKNLGLNKLTSWSNCILVNAEHSLVTETMQGGAVNRIIDIEVGNTDIYEDGHHVAEIVRHNFGFAGRQFVDVIKEVGIDEIKKIHQKYYSKIKECARKKGVEKEDKQIMPLSIILTADELAESYLFKDGIRLDIDKTCDLLKNKGEVNEHDRAYMYLLETISSNRHHFIIPGDNSSENVSMETRETWGILDENSGKCKIIGSIFDNILAEAGFQSRAFFSWAIDKKIIEPDSRGCPKRSERINGINTRCVVLHIDKLNDGFIDLSDDIDLPF